jgi:serpin peptidase inhibitor clade A protein 3
VPFDPDDTFMGKFLVDRRRTAVKVQMMKTENQRTLYFRDEELKCTVVELNYEGNGKAMFILPDQGRTQQVEASLQPKTLKKWRKSLRPRCVSSGARTDTDSCTAAVLMASVSESQILTNT